MQKLLWIIIFLTKIFHVGLHLFSNRSQMTSKYVKSKHVANQLLGKCVSHYFAKVVRTSVTMTWFVNFIVNFILVSSN